MGICWQKVNLMFMIINSAGPSPQDCLHPPWQSALGVTWEVFCWEALRKSNEIKWKGTWIWQSYYSTKFCEPWILNDHHHQPSAQSLQVKHTPKQNLPPHHKKSPGTAWGSWQRAYSVHLASKCPRSKSDGAAWDVPEKWSSVECCWHEGVCFVRNNVLVGLMGQRSPTWTPGPRVSHKIIVL